MSFRFFCFALTLSLSLTSFAQDAVGYLQKADEVSHNPKLRGLKDLVVDLVSPQMTKQLNDQKIFGNIREVSFRIFWTAQPERLSIEVNGLPEGFREIKEELKAAMIGRLESIIPLPLEKKLQGYKFRIDARNPRTVIAADATNLRPIPEYELGFDVDGKLVSMVAKKPVGLVTSTFIWSKAPWSEPRFYVTRVTSRSEEGPQLTETETETSWQTIAGIGFPSAVRTKIKQSLKQPGSPGRPIERSIDETLLFKNYKVNAGEAMKWFLGHSTATP
jgi:hypothetical protein